MELETTNATRKLPRTGAGGPLRPRRKESQAEGHLADNVLVCHRISLDTGQARLADALFALFSRGYLVEAAFYARREPTYLLTVQGVFDDTLAQTLRQNLVGVPDLVPCDAPEGVLSSIHPLGQVLSAELNAELALRLRQDPLVTEYANEQMVKRMEANPGVDFIFPDLSPEEYTETKAKLGRKKS
jgi:hypothetical protein